MSRRDDSSRLADVVVAWQRQHGRHHLPWQGTRDPYRVWLSEIMLQQTQVSTVLGYYERFLARFPDVVQLAQAPLDDVLALWAGLGYYSRARHLHRCAQQVVSQWQGQFPRSAAALAELPGIGTSTAHAIAAFCYDERCAILDGNVKRVLTRVLAWDKDLAVARHERELWALAQDLVPARAQDMPAYTQGVMDLGATVCRQRSPDCQACPLSAMCQARCLGQVERFPVRTRKLVRRSRRNALLWLCRGHSHWLVQRPPRGVWAGLWSLPEYDDLDELLADIAEWPAEPQVLAPVVHVLTHLDWTLQPVRVQVPAHFEPSPALSQRWPGGAWVAQDRLAAYGLPAPVARWLER